MSNSIQNAYCQIFNTLNVKVPESCANKVFEKIQRAGNNILQLNPYKLPSNAEITALKNRVKSTGGHNPKFTLALNVCAGIKKKPDLLNELAKLTHTADVLKHHGNNYSALTYLDKEKIIKDIYIALKECPRIEKDKNGKPTLTNEAILLGKLHRTYDSNITSNNSAPVDLSKTIVNNPTLVDKFINTLTESDLLYRKEIMNELVKITPTHVLTKKTEEINDKIKKIDNEIQTINGKIIELEKLK